MQLEHIAYLSKATPGLAHADMDRILEQSRLNNARLRITGHLQCHGGEFFQVLEGTPEALDALLEKLMHDTRHHDLRVLYREPLARRNFAGWSMGYGPCHPIPGRDTILTRLQRLRDAAPCSANQALTCFFALLAAPAH